MGSEKERFHSYQFEVSNQKEEKLSCNIVYETASNAKIYPCIIEFFKKVALKQNSRHIPSIKLSPVEFGYNYTNEEWNLYQHQPNLLFDYDCKRLKDADEKISLALLEKEQVVHIGPILLESEWVESNQEILDSLFQSYSGSGGRKMSSYSVYPQHLERVDTIRYAVSKKPSFDPIFKVMNEYLPHLTERRFATYQGNYIAAVANHSSSSKSQEETDYSSDSEEENLQYKIRTFIEKFNHDFVSVEEIKNGQQKFPENILFLEDITGTRMRKTGFHNLFLHIICCDLKKNIDLISLILQNEVHPPTTS